MFKNLVKQLLVLTLTCSTFTCGYVRAMKRDKIWNMAYLKQSIKALAYNSIVEVHLDWDIADVNKNIKSLINNSIFEMLQYTLDVLSKHSTPLSIKAHEVLVNHIRTLTQHQLKELFELLRHHEESTLKMAVRLVYAQKHKENLDHLDCLYFIKNINNWVNGCEVQGTTLLFSQAYLQFTLPLLESIINDHVTCLKLAWNELTSLPDSIGNLVNVTRLSLSNNQLTSLPDSIDNLVNLKVLYLSNNQLTIFPDSIGNLINLKELCLDNNELTSLPDSIGNLVNLEWLMLWKNKLTNVPDNIGNLRNLTMLNLSKNKLTDEIKERLKQQCKNIKNFGL